MLTRARSVVDGLLAALLAAPCVVCGRVLDRPTRGAACEECWAAVRLITPPYCQSCGTPMPPVRLPGAGGARCPEVAHPEQRCARCAAARPIVDLARALGPYDGALRVLLHGLKYDGRRSIAPRLAALMRQRCGRLLDGAQAVVPVPLHPRRQWTRGFNQAEVIARELGLPVWPALRRTRHTLPQASLTAHERHLNVRDAFRVRGYGRGGWGTALAGASLVLVDDVATTGATLDACASALKRAGVAEVRAVTVARAVLEHPGVGVGPAVAPEPSWAGAPTSARAAR